MYKTDIAEQSIEIEGRRFTAADRETLSELARKEPDEALRPVYVFLSEWFSPDEEMEVQTSGSTGEPKRMRVSKARMICSAVKTCSYLSLCPVSVALLCMDMKYIGAKMMVVRALVCGMRLVVRRPSRHPLADVKEHVDFVAMVPLQFYQTLQTKKEREKLKRIHSVIIGGGAVDETVLEDLYDFPVSCRIYSTYGMTETLSHIALRSLNGCMASERYTPLEGVSLSLSSRGTLTVHVPDVCEETLETNDVVRLYPDGTFTVIGRSDNVVNSGGIKIQIEEDEKLLRPYMDVPFALTSVPDPSLGEALVLLVAQDGCFTVRELFNLAECHLPRYHKPRHIRIVDRIPETENGKIDRKACRELALHFLSGK